MICSEVYVNHERLYTFETSNKEKGYIGLMRSPIYSYIIDNTLSTVVVVANLARALSHDNMDGVCVCCRRFFYCAILWQCLFRGMFFNRFSISFLVHWQRLVF